MVSPKPCSIVVAICPFARDDGAALTLSCLMKGMFHLWLYILLWLTSPACDKQTLPQLPQVNRRCPLDWGICCCSLFVSLVPGLQGFAPCAVVVLQTCLEVILPPLSSAAPSQLSVPMLKCVIFLLVISL